VKTKLNHIANIQTGVFAKTVAHGDIAYLQPTYFDESGKLTTAIVPNLNSIDIPKNHILQNGDILFASKGLKLFATCLNLTEVKAAASTSFFVIRIKSDSVLPHYVTWFLNHPTTMNSIKSFARGTSIQSISKEVLNELEIKIPSLKKQELIVKIAELRAAEERLQAKIHSLKHDINQQQLYNAIK
jgi:restriction endonuclease S subunit